MIEISMVIIHSPIVTTGVWLFSGASIMQFERLIYVVSISNIQNKMGQPEN
jgi:hypothetical protein